MNEQKKATKRLAVDIPERIFWALKAAAAEQKLYLKDIVPLAVADFLNIDIDEEEEEADETISI